MRKRHAVTLFLVACLLAMTPVAALAQRKDDDDLEIPDDAVPALFIDVVDGDTIIVELDDEDGETVEETVRMIGIDTPETNYSYGNEPECYGEEATKKTESLLVAADGEIWLESDVRDRDPNGRLLRYVWYISEIDGKVHFLNEELVREGYALANTYRPTTARQDELDAAEREAIRDFAGMWLTCDASVSADPDEEDPESGPDDVPIDRTKEPAEVEEDAACSFFDTFDQAQDFLDEYPELADIIDPDFDGTACEDYFDVDR